MESVGEFFRHVRETKGLTIDEVASKTRIRADFLKALEEGNFAKLPDQVFAKGFVRTYARSLGLDEEDAMHRFVQSAGTFYDKQEERERLRVKQAEDERRRRSNRKALSLAVGVALLVLVLLLTREQSGLILTGPAPEPPPVAVQNPLPDSLPPSETVGMEQGMPPVADPAAETPQAGTEGQTVAGKLRIMGRTAEQELELRIERTLNAMEIERASGKRKVSSLASRPIGRTNSDANSPIARVSEMTAEGGERYSRPLASVHS